MDEKIIVKSEQYNIKKVCITIFCVFALIAFVVFLSIEKPGYWIERYEDAASASSLWYDASRVAGYKSIKNKAITNVILYPCLIGGFFSLITFWWLSKTEMIVSNKRVYGKTVFGKRVDLPLDSISAIGSKWPKGVGVATSSGRIAFLMVKNRDEIHKCVSNLLIERQTKPTAATAIKQEAPKSDADELKKYKELLDSGIITQEEFDAKKKQLLGLS